MHFMVQIFALDYIVVKTQNWCSLHGSFLTLQCINTENDLIRLTHYEDTKKTAHDSQIARAKVNLKLSHGGPSQRQAPDTNQPIKGLRSAVIVSDAWPNVEQLKRKPWL